MKPSFRFAILFLLGLLLILGSGCSGKTKHSPIPAGSSVLVIGDSVTYGTGAELGRDYPSRLTLFTGWVVHNAGIPGDTSVGVKNRVEDALAETEPALVLLEIGGNDFIRRTSSAEIKENIRATLKQIKARGIPVVLIAVPQFSPLGAALRNLPDAPLYAELAEEESVPLIPDVFANVLSDPRLKSDTIHPNGDGYAKMAQDIEDALDEMGFVESR